MIDEDGKDPSYFVWDTTEVDDHNGASGVLEYMAQSDSWSGLFYDHHNVTRMRSEIVEYSNCVECGRDLHGYRGPLCRYCDPEADCE
jgi:hypothetical protein